MLNFLAILALNDQARPLPVLIENGLVIDGSGRAGKVQDIRLVGNRITET